MKSFNEFTESSNAINEEVHTELDFNGEVTVYYTQTSGSVMGKDFYNYAVMGEGRSWELYRSPKNYFLRISKGDSIITIVDKDYQLVKRFRSARKAMEHATEDVKKQ